MAPNVRYSLVVMKTKSKPTQFLPFTSAVIAAGSFALLAGPGTAQGQVKIEGGPSTVQISDNDGKPEAAAATGSITAEVPTPADIPTVDAIVVRPVPNSDVTVRVPVVTPDTETSITPGEVIATAVVPAPKAEIQPEVVRELTRLERELNIARSATVAEVSFRSEDLFEDDMKQIEASAESTLNEFVRYMSLLDGKKASITYHYVLDRETASDASEKAAQLVSWFAEKESIGNYGLTIEPPEIVVKPVPREGKPGTILTEYTSFVEIVLER